MNFNTRDIAQTLVELEIPAEQQGGYLSTAVACSVAYGLPLPTQAVPSGAAYFDAELATAAAQSLNGLNEAFPLDYTQTISLVRAFWLARYHLVYPVSFQNTLRALDQALSDQSILPEGVSLRDHQVANLCRVLGTGVA